MSRIRHIAIIVPDAEEAAKFYEKALGLKRAGTARRGIYMTDGVINVALLTNMAKFAGLPWDLIMSAELFAHYKPDPETYLGAARLLCLPPGEVMMVAAHNYDLKAARKLGLKTAFVARPTEYGPLQKQDFEATDDWDVVASDFGGIADRMGC